MTRKEFKKECECSVDDKIIGYGVSEERLTQIAQKLGFVDKDRNLMAWKIENYFNCHLIFDDGSFSLFGGYEVDFYPV